MSELTVTVLALHVRSGREEEFAAAFRDNEVLAAAQAESGMLFAQLLRPAAPGAPFIALAHWPNREAYDCWISSPVREQLNAALGEFLTDKPVSGDLYRPVDQIADEDIEHRFHQRRDAAKHQHGKKRQATCQSRLP